METIFSSYDELVHSDIFSCAIIDETYHQTKILRLQNKGDDVVY